MKTGILHDITFNESSKFTAGIQSKVDPKELKVILNNPYNEYTSIFTDVSSIELAIENGNNILISPNETITEIEFSFDSGWLSHGTSDLVTTFILSGQDIIPDFTVINEDDWSELTIDTEGQTDIVWMKFGDEKWRPRGL